MATFDDASHVTALSDSLQRLRVQQRSTTLEQSREENLIQESKRSASVPRNSFSRDGYGFRSSGISTPLTQAPPVDEAPHSQLAQELLVPDPNGLGWPGVFLSPC
jgi:GTP cyclohydrolase I